MPSKAELRAQWNAAGKDVVILHQFNRGRKCPNSSPFPLKMETYLRVAKIEYVVDSTQFMSSKGKTPWMTFNGTDVADSQLCMEHLAKALPGKNLSAHLSKEERAVARGIRAIMEDHLYFCMVMLMWKHGDLKYLREEVLAPLPVPKMLQSFVFGQISKTLAKQCHGQGIGRHSKEEVTEMAMGDLRAVSDYLGEKDYLMGGDSPTEVDCVVFGFVAQLVFSGPKESVLVKALDDGGNLANLKRHCLRVKERYYPDWDELLYKDKN